MKIKQVAIQLYTLRDFCKTAEDFAATAKKVRAIGYEAVQVSGVGPIPESEIVRMLQGEGLVCCATHEPGDVIRKEPQKVVDRLSKLGCKYTAYPFPAGVDIKSKVSVLDLAKDLDSSGAVLKKAGQTLCYHNHALEFARIDGKLVLDYLFEHTNSENLQGELDTYWVQHGGSDMVEWCKKLRKRMPLIHLKDYGVNPENHQPVYTEVGSGNLNFKAIISEAEKSGCEWFIVEQDTCPGDPFISIQKSFEYIKANLIS